MSNIPKHKQHQNVQHWHFICVKLWVGTKEIIEIRCPAVWNGDFTLPSFGQVTPPPTCLSDRHHCTRQFMDVVIVSVIVQ